MTCNPCMPKLAELSKNTHFTRKEITRLKTAVAAVLGELPTLEDCEFVEYIPVEEGMIKTNGEYLIFNPHWTSRIDFNNLIWIVAHEMMHKALDHTERFDKITRMMHSKEFIGPLFNKAADLEVNEILDHMDGMPDDADVPGKGKYEFIKVGMCAEEMFFELMRKYLQEEQKIVKNTRQLEDELIQTELKGG